MFLNRRQAGQLLSQKIKQLNLQKPIMLALPRGGVPVAAEISWSLNIPFDVLIVRKISVPEHPEYGLGAMTEGGTQWIDSENLKIASPEPRELEEEIAAEKAEVERRQKLYRRGRPLPNLRDRAVIIVDDGLATGVTARAACLFARHSGANPLVVAVPVASESAAFSLKSLVDHFICLHETAFFFAVGQFYESFEQLTDDQVLEILDQFHRPQKGVPYGTEKDQKMVGKSD